MSYALRELKIYFNRMVENQEEVFSKSANRSIFLFFFGLEANGNISN